MNTEITQEEIRVRAQRNAEAQALADLQAEQARRESERARVRSTNAGQAHGALAAEVDKLKREAKPLYMRRAELVSEIAPVLAELEQIALQLSRFDGELAAVADGAARQLQDIRQQPDVLIAQIRRQAGLPEQSDAMPAGLSGIGRVVGRAIALGLLGSNGIGSIYQKGLIQL